MSAGGTRPQTGALDADAARRLRDGDQEALGELYVTHLRGIHDFLARFTRDPQAAEDLAQATFLRAWERRETLRDPARVRGWLYAIAHNLALNHVTRSRAVEPLEGASAQIEDPGRGPEEAAVAEEAADLVWAAASSLEPRQYAILDLSVRRDLSLREIAGVLGVNVAHAAVLANRARDALGNAVRYLLVARQRDQCERLAELVPAGVRTLSAQQRRTVDHHMRSCEECQKLGAWLTSPTQLLGNLLPVPVPEALAAGGVPHLLGALPSLAHAPAPALPRPWQKRGNQAAALATVCVLVLGAVFAFRLATVRTPARGAPPGPPPVAVIPAGTAPPALPPPSAVPSPPATPAPVAVATPGPTPVAVVSTPVPTPPPAAPPAPAPTPTPAPPPPFSVTSISARGLDSIGCEPVVIVLPTDVDYDCAFLVVVQVANATGGETVAGTVTAVTHEGEVVTAPFQATVTAAGPSTLSTTVELRFEACPHGTVTATTQTPSSATSPDARFGLCVL